MGFIIRTLQFRNLHPYLSEQTAGSEGLALHLGVQDPFGETGMAHGKVQEPESHGAEEETEEFLFALHLTEDLTVGLVKRLVLEDGALGVVGGLEGVIEALARYLVGEAAGIANKDYIINGRMYGVQWYEGANEAGLWDVEVPENLTEGLAVGLWSTEAVDVAAYAGELIEATGCIVAREVDKDFIGPGLLYVLLHEEHLVLGLA